MLSRIVVIVALVAFVLGGFGMAGDPMGSPSTLRSRAAGYGECAVIGIPDRRRYRGRMDWAEVVAEVIWGTPAIDPKGDEGWLQVFWHAIFRRSPRGRAGGDWPSPPPRSGFRESA